MLTSSAPYTIFTKLCAVLAGCDQTRNCSFDWPADGPTRMEVAYCMNPVYLCALIYAGYYCRLRNKIARAREKRDAR